MSHYRMEIEIYEGNGGRLKHHDGVVVRPDFVNEGVCAWMHYGDGENSYQVGHRFNYPVDNGKICPWLLGSMDGFIKALMYGGTLPWDYKGTPYEKVVDKEGVTTEFVRCPDPSKCGIVVKLIRTRVDG